MRSMALNVPTNIRPRSFWPFPPKARMTGLQRRANVPSGRPGLMAEGTKFDDRLHIPALRQSSRASAGGQDILSPNTSNTPRLIRNTKGGPLYYLIWAGPHPAGLPGANHIMNTMAR